MRALAVFGLMVIIGAPAWAQHSARDAFWSASDLVSVSSNTAARPNREATTTVPKRRPASTPTASPHVDPVLVAQNGYGQAPHMVRVSQDQIGLRYSILLRDAAGSYKEASPTAVFHSGDYLHLSVMANQAGYLYVIQQGSSGNWSPIFPRKGSAPESNKVEQGKLTEIPEGSGAFKFDATPGQEKLFIIVSRRPLDNLDQVIAGLKTPGAQTGTPPKTADLGTYEALNQIPADLERRFASRDLTLVEDVDASKKPEAGGEKAVYVVSTGTATSGGPQVVAAVTLHHE